MEGKGQEIRVRVRAVRGATATLLLVMGMASGDEFRIFAAALSVRGATPSSGEWKGSCKLFMSVATPPVATPSRSIAAATAASSKARSKAGESDFPPFYYDHPLEVARPHQASTDEFLQVHERTLEASAAVRTAQAQTATSNGTSAEWSRAGEIAQVVGRTMRPILASWIRSRAFASSSTSIADADFWSMRSDEGGRRRIGGVGQEWQECQSLPTHADRVTLALEELGCTFVKFGQALSSRPDVIPPTLASAFAKLRDRMEPFETPVAVEIVRRELSAVMRDGNAATAPGHTFDENGLDDLLASFSDKPVAAASIGQVYKGQLAGFGPVAVKVRRPNIETTVERDAAMLKGVAQRIERFSRWYQSTTKRPPLIQAKLSDAVDEFMSRINEELDYRREAQNLQTFADLYSVSSTQSSSSVDDNSKQRKRHVQVVVPRLARDLCTENVLVMEWLNGTKLVDDESGNASPGEARSPLELQSMAVHDTDPMADRRTNLALVEKGIQCTLSQLLDTGILHADPHAGNLLKVPRRLVGSSDISYELGYLDFGLVSTVPPGVRDGLVCAVAQLVFARNVDKVAQLFGDLQLLPDRVINDPNVRRQLTSALNDVFDRVLDYNATKVPSAYRPSTQAGHSNVPVLRFDNLLYSLSGLVTRFEFRLPPYFLNNARALGTLEGIAKSLDPTFNVLRVVYPYALDRLLTNPSDSPVVDDTLIDLVQCPQTGRIDFSRVARLLHDSASLTGYSRLHVVRDVLKSRRGRRFAWRVAKEVSAAKLTAALRWGSATFDVAVDDSFRL